MKKVAILGFAPSRDLAPFDKEDIEIWGLNDLHAIIPKAKNITRWFDIHPYEQLKTMPVRNGSGSYIENLKNLPCPVYMQEQYADIPNSVKYPKDLMVEKYGRYFTNSISWMMASAIDEDYEEIDLFGVDMAQDSEYAFQRPSCEYFIGLARGKGIKVIVPDECSLLKTPFLYGFDEEPRDIAKDKYRLRAKELNDRLVANDLNKTKALLQHGYLEVVKENYFLLGALEDTNFYLNQWT